MQLGPDIKWHSLDRTDTEFHRIDRELFAGYPADLNPRRYEMMALDVAHAACYPEILALRVGVRSAQTGPWPVYAVMTSRMVVAGTFIQYMAGRPLDLYALNLRTRLMLQDDEQIGSYLRLWFEFTRGTNGWCLVESPGHLHWRASPDVRQSAAAAAMIRPAEVEDPDTYGRRFVSAVVQVEGGLVERRFALWPVGLMQSQGERILLREPALASPDLLMPFSALRGTPFAEHPEEGAEPSDVLMDSHFIPPHDDTVAEDAAPDNSPEIDDMEDRTHSEWNLGAVFMQLAGILLRSALNKDFRAEAEQDPQTAFNDYLRTFRPTVVIETPYQELRAEFARHVSDGSRLPVNLAWENGAVNDVTLTSTAHVVLLTDSSFPRNADGTNQNIGQWLAPIIRGPHVALMVVEDFDALPQDARDMVDLTLRIPRMDAAAFWSCTAALFQAEPKREQADWLRYVLPRDMARIAAATRSLDRYLDELAATIHRRLAQYTVPDAPSLHELQGLGEARHRMEELAGDIRAALDGAIGWHLVDRGYLLVGPPGTGKTTLVRALAKDCGIRFILASASAWQEGSSLAPHIQNIRDTFEEARFYAPVILFIDEIDGIGSRNKTEARNSQYQTMVVNTLLEELQGFRDREGVIVIGATNNPDNVDEALRRPGRLDRQIEVPYPNVAALANIYSYYLNRAAKDGVPLGEVNLQRLAQLTFGRTGAHVELYVRAASRRVVREGRGHLTEQDLLAEITHRPAEGFGRILSREVMRHVAVHEAGHALVALTGCDRERDIPMVSITPRSNGSLGFVARAPSEMGTMTRADMEESIRVILGGRAAEEVVFGREHVSGGAGGSAESDLARATQSVLWLLTEFGFSQAGGLLWIDWRGQGSDSQLTAQAIRNLPMGDEILQEARGTADRLYAETLDRVQTHRQALDRVVDALVQRQELSSDELRATIADERHAAG